MSPVQSHSYPQSQSPSSQPPSTAPVEVPPSFYRIAHGSYFSTLPTVARRSYIHGLEDVVRGSERETSSNRDESSPWSLPAWWLPKETLIVIIHLQEMDRPGGHVLQSKDKLCMEKEYANANQGTDDWINLKIVVKNPDGSKTDVAYVAEEDLPMLRRFPKNLDQVRLKYLHVQNFLGMRYPIAEYTIRPHPEPLSPSLLQSSLSTLSQLLSLPLPQSPVAAYSLFPFYNAHYIRTLHPSGRQPYLQGIQDAMAGIYQDESLPPRSPPASCLPTATFNMIIRVRGMYYRGGHMFHSTDEVSLEKLYRKNKKGGTNKWPTLKVLVKNENGNQRWVANVGSEDNRLLREFPDVEKARLLYMNYQCNYQACFLLLYPASEYDLGVRIPMSMEVDYSGSQVSS